MALAHEQVDVVVGALPDRVVEPTSDRGALEEKRRDFRRF